jgi:hypothetical protein
VSDTLNRRRAGNSTAPDNGVVLNAVQIMRELLRF